MIQRPFDQITNADVNALVTDAVREIRTLDYKGSIPGGSDEDRREFLYDVSSLANAAGGDLIYGIPSKDGVPVEPAGIPALNSDAEILRLENMIRDGIAPRIPGIRTRELTGFPRGSVLVLRVPKSWAAPHMVTHKNVSRFYSRNSAGKYQLDVGEIRAAFAQSELLPERIKQFRDERITQIVAGQTPVPLPDNPKVVVHVIPMSAFAPSVPIQPSVMYQHRSLLAPFSASGWNNRLNIDGLLSFSGPREGARHLLYCQAFRNGILESVNARFLLAGERKLIPGTAFAKALVGALEDYHIFLRTLEVSAPLVVTCALLGARDYLLASSQDWMVSDPMPVDRDVLILPEVTIDARDDIPGQVRPMLDGLWNAGGYQRCPHYDLDGAWTPQG